MLVTILTVVYNNEQTLSRTIESVLNQSYPEIEYIIIDGASKDHSADIARSYIPAFSKVGKKLIVISEPDKGMYDGLNKGAKLASGELIGQVNSDDWYDLDAVQNIVDFYKNTHFDVAWGDVRVKGSKGDFIKHAKIGKLWTTRGWNHGAMFSRSTVIKSHPYPLESMYDDFDYITLLHCEGYKLLTLNIVLEEFTPGGMSSQHSISEFRRRINITYGIYRKYGMSRLYYFDRVIVEIAKLILMR